MEVADLDSYIDELCRLIDQEVVTVDQAAGELGVSRTTLGKWRRREVGLRYKNMLALRLFLQKHGNFRGSQPEPAVPQTISPAKEGIGVQMNPEHMRLLADIISIPPELQPALRASVDSIKAIAVQLEASKQKKPEIAE